mgnify:CR=1 FL=1
MEKYRLYIVLTRTKTVLSRLIHQFTKDEYTHVALSFDEELETMYSFGRKYTFNPFIGGFKKEEIDKGLYKFYHVVPCRIVEIEVSRKQYEKARQLIDNFISKGDFYKYNYKGLLYCALNKAVCDEKRFLCSEFVYHVLKESGIVDFKISRNLVRPQSFLSLEGRNIYQGNLKEVKYRKNSCVSNGIQRGA